MLYDAAFRAYRDFFYCGGGEVVGVGGREAMVVGRRDAMGVGGRGTEATVLLWFAMQLLVYVQSYVLHKYTVLERGG